MIAADHLDERLLALVAHIVSALPPPGSAVSEHAAAARVVAGTATMVDVETPPHLARVPLPNGPLPIDAHVYRGGVLTGEVLVWIRDGRLIGLEQAWFTDDPPEDWPAPADVRVSVARLHAGSDPGDWVRHRRTPTP